MPKKTKELEEKATIENQDFQKSIEDFMSWYIEEFMRPRQDSEKEPFYMEISMLPPYDAKMIIGQKDIDAYLEEKKEKLGKEIETIINILQS